MSKLPKRPIETLEDQCTHTLSEWLNNSAPIGEERYREPAKAVIKLVLDKCHEIAITQHREGFQGNPMPSTSPATVAKAIRDLLTQQAREGEK
jgi:hypothetical protein